MGKKVLNITLFDSQIITKGKLPYINVTKIVTNYQTEILFSHSAESLLFLAIIYILYEILYPILDCDLKREKRHMKFYHEEPCINWKDFMKIPL